jgi:iron-sulfur cluster assembly protein
MALDEPKEDDEVKENNGITYMINKQLFEQVKPISVDFVESAMGSGFAINSGLKRDGGCGSSCSC